MFSIKYTIKFDSARALRRAAFAFAAFAALSTHAVAQAQSAPAGSIEFSASVTPTDARPQPVRQFTFYLLRKSIADIHTEVQAADPPPQLDVFIDTLTVSPEMKAWMKKNHTVDLAGSDFTHNLAPQAILDVPEFMNAYVKFNTGYYGSGFPTPKYKAIDMQKNPDKYARQVKEYRTAVLNYAIANPTTKDGMESELTDLNPTQKWHALVMAELDRVHKLTLRTAQTQYLVAQTDSDLNGEGLMNNIPPGDYWLGTLGAVAQAGDIRQAWDVRVTVRAGQTTSVALTNLNAAPPLFPAQ
jgi:hypothetical protein